MIISIIQPDYLPWAGYFNLMMRSDIFVLLDDVQLDKRSWQQRNRVILNGRECMLTIPVLTKNKMSQLIRDTEIDTTQNWRQKHFGTLTNAYKKHPFGKEVLEIYESEIFSNSTTNLCELTSSFIIRMRERIGFNAQIIFSHTLNANGKKSEKLYNICKKLDGSIYLSPQGARDYIEQEKIFEHYNFPVIFQNYVPQEYPQKGVESFVPYMSVLDLIANVGFENAGDVIMNGYTPPPN